MLFLLIGLVLVLFVSLDVIRTTLGLNGAGPLAGWVAGGVWRVLLGLHRRSDSHRMLSFGGTIILLAIALVWAVGAWGGWILIFHADPYAVLHSETKAPADLVGRMYFVGYTLVTLGIGNYVPQGGWQIVTVLCSFYGLASFTLAISYLLPVLGAATESRQLAATISGLGETPQEILTQAWTGEDFGDLTEHLVPLTTALGAYTHAHQAYPVLHYFHGTNPDAAPALQIAVLDEAVTLLLCGVREPVRPATPTLSALRSATSSHLRILEAVYIERGDEPPSPDLAPLRACGISTVSDEAFREVLQDLEDRRRTLHGLVRQDGWAWEEVTARHEGAWPGSARTAGSA